MTTSLDGWAQAFHFSQDLEKLETVYQEQHQAELKAIQTPQATVEATAAPILEETSNEVRLDTLAVEIASRIGGFLGEPDVMSHYLKLQELQRDNQLMASYIQDLLERVHLLEQENRQFRREKLIRHIAS
jgi:hypothetical protein